MHIQTIDVRQYSASGFSITENNLYHQKSLPVLSVVQSTEGSYKIGIDTKKQVETGKMGTFIAPSGKMQYITHCVDRETGRMKAHWIFLDVIVNQQKRLDDLYDFPTLLDAEYRSPVNEIIENVQNSRILCDNLSEIYKLIKILLAIGTVKNDINEFESEMKKYISLHYMEKITDGQLSKQFAMSKPTLYRKFKSNMGMTPANYINDVRLTQSIILLETADMPINRICKSVGVDDVFYFSRLFKRKYGQSPALYRKSLGLSEK